MITVHHQAVNAGGSFAAAQLIASVNDPGGYTVIACAFRDDGGSSGGYFSLGGVAQASGSWITVSAADLQASWTAPGGQAAGRVTSIA